MSGPAESSGAVVMSRVAAVYWIFGVLFLLVWAFGLGVVVGRGSIFEWKALQALETRLLGQPLPSTAPAVEYGQGEQLPPAPLEASSDAPQDSDKKPELTFYDSFAQVKPPIEPKPNLKDTEPETKTTKKTTDTKKAADAAKDANKKVPDAGTKSAAGPDGSTPHKAVDPDRTKAPPPSRKPGENFTIQVAAAKTTDEAEKTVKKLRKDGFDAYYYEVEVEDRRYFRIRVGRFAKREEALAVLKKMEKSGQKGLFISSLTD
jgi:cell division protein FtsN